MSSTILLKEKVSGITVTRATKEANILLPFGSGVSAHVYAFFENEGKSKYSPDHMQWSQYLNG